MQETLEFDANHPYVLWALAAAYAGKGLYKKAISVMQGIRNIPMLSAYLGYLYGKARDKGEAQIILDDFLDRAKRGHFSPYLIAIVYYGLGEKDKVFEWLDKAYETRDITQTWLKAFPPFTDLYSDSRWAEVLKKRGLPV